MITSDDGNEAARRFLSTPPKGVRAWKPSWVGVRSLCAQLVQTGGTLVQALLLLPGGVTPPAEADYRGMTQTLTDHVLRAAEHALTVRSTP